ncbi:MAG: PhzF family phenazine biosynthesis isomerase [Gemmatimonadetes bacterium]|nr:PhzF family phenazine biosynthesis isomerase [Gemmatimonadota bacterium]
MPAPDPHPTRDLSRLLAGMAPVLDPTPWAFCRVPEGRLPDGVEPVATVREVEGLTAVVAAADAARLGWPAVFAARRIILTVHSDLQAVGFMARVSAALTEHGIPCNVAAGIAHDHLFVPEAAAGAALARLEALAARPGLRFRLVDVFTDRAYAGNGLAVFPEAAGFTAAQMQAIAAELRQVESIFLERTPEPRRVRARIFTPEEELPFAGHPSLGAAAVLHEETADGEAAAEWQLELTGRTVPVTTRRTAAGLSAEMRQGIATFLPPLSTAAAAPFHDALGMAPALRHPALPLQTVSTGLPYLIVPVAGDLGAARIRHPEFEALLATVGAKFVYLLDPARREGRTWLNDGIVEDPATGSAAGPAGAYLVRHGLAVAGERQRILQGARAGRPSDLWVTIEARHDALEVRVAGTVVPVGSGLLAALPAP